MVKSYPKEVWVGWFSSLVEAYNMAIYSFIAPLLAPLLFQQTNAWTAVFFSYALVFLGSCFMYPAGAAYYGLIGDRYGRQKTCIYSTLGLAVATGLMGLLPFHFFNESWIFFLIFISAQYFFSGGEYYGSIVFSLEHHDQKQNGLMSALSCLFAVFGIILANGLATLAFVFQNEWWIRLCFLVGALGGLISYAMKYHCSETPVFNTLKQKMPQEVEWIPFLRKEWRRVTKAVFVFAFFMVSYAFIFIFLPLIYPEANTENFSTFKSLIAYGILLVLSGLIADKWGTHATILTGLCLFSALIIPVTLLSNNLFILQMVLTPVACLVIGPIHGWMLHQFIPSQRCRGIFISSATAISIFGGSTVPICLLIYEASNSIVLCSLFPLGIAISAISALIFINQPKEAALEAPRGV